MSEPCQHILVRNGSKTFRRCEAVSIYIDSKGLTFCPRHFKSGYGAVRLIIESLFILPVNSEPTERSVKTDAVHQLGGQSNSGGSLPTPHAESCELHRHSLKESCSTTECDSSLLPRVSTCHAIDLTDASSEVIIDFNGYNYRDIGDLVEKHSVYLPKAKQKGCEWRLLSNPVVGEINGLPMFRGMALATNGVHVAIETATGALIFGHLNWFIVDPKEPESKKRELFPTVVKPNKQVLELESLFL